MPHLSRWKVSLKKEKSTPIFVCNFFALILSVFQVIKDLACQSEINDCCGRCCLPERNCKMWARNLEQYWIVINVFKWDLIQSLAICCSLCPSQTWAIERSEASDFPLHFKKNIPSCYYSVVTSFFVSSSRPTSIWEKTVGSNIRDFCQRWPFAPADNKGCSL